MPTCTMSMDIINKIVTVCVCLLIIAASLFNAITLGGFSISSLIFSIYFMYILINCSLFALVLIIAECRILMFLKYFRLLAFRLGKAVYCIMYQYQIFRIGGLMIQNVNFGLTMICAFIVFGLGVYYLFMHFLV